MVVKGFSTGQVVASHREIASGTVRKLRDRLFGSLTATAIRNRGRRKFVVNERQAMIEVFNITIFSMHRSK